MAEQTVALAQMSRDRLLDMANKLATGIQTTRRSLKRMKDAAEDPLKMSGVMLSGLAGAALSGVITGFTPPNHRFQYYDTVVGAAVALGSLATAGSYAGDLLIGSGIAMYSPGISRLVAAPIRARQATKK